MKNDKVICIYATKYKACSQCLHSTPHKRDIDGHTDICTNWGECWLDDIAEEIKVRCVKVKDKT